MGWYLWAEFPETETVSHFSSSIVSTHRHMWLCGILWCLWNRLRMCIDAAWEGNCLCLKTTTKTWSELSYPWLRNGSSDICPKNMETLFVWRKMWNLYRSQKSLVYPATEGSEPEAKKMGGTAEGLWLSDHVPSEESKCSGWCSKQKVNGKFSPRSRTEEGNG